MRKIYTLRWFLFIFVGDFGVGEGGLLNEWFC